MSLRLPLESAYWKIACWSDRFLPVPVATALTPVSPLRIHVGLERPSAHFCQAANVSRAQLREKSAERLAIGCRREPHTNHALVPEFARLPRRKKR